MVNISIFFLIIIVHFVADFIFQDERWALGKSKDLECLLLHTATYSALWVFPMLIYTNDMLMSVIFAIITFICHTITDYITSRIVSKRFKDNHLGSSIPNLGAFTIIGGDQVLHYVQLILTYYLLFIC